MAVEPDGLAWRSCARLAPTRLLEGRRPLPGGEGGLQTDVTASADDALNPRVGPTHASRTGCCSPKSRRCLFCRLLRPANAGPRARRFPMPAPAWQQQEKGGTCVCQALCGCCATTKGGGVLERSRHARRSSERTDVGPALLCRHPRPPSAPESLSVPARPPGAQRTATSSARVVSARLQGRPRGHRPARHRLFPGRTSV